MESLSAIIRHLQGAASSGQLPYLEAYLDLEDGILHHISSMTGVKSEFYCFDNDEIGRMAKYLALFSDFTSVFTVPSINGEYTVQHYRPDHRRFIARQITIPPTLRYGSLNGHLPMMACYIVKSDADFKHIMASIDPLVSNGRFLVRPMRAIWVNLSQSLSPANIQHEIYFAASDTPNDHWRVKEINEKDSIIIDNGLKRFQSKQLLELTLPYFEGISVGSLAKILDDETDLLAAFRVALKEITRSLVETDHVSEYVNDKVRPQIETINRKFNTINSLHRLSVGASVASFTISLIGVQVSSNINFQSLFNTLLGTSTIGFLATEIKYQTEMDKLKDNPYFLLWKISKAKG